MELSKEASIVFDEEAYIADPPANHRQALQANAESEAGAAGVELLAGGFVDIFEHGGVDHAAACNFNPARSLPRRLQQYVNLEAGLGEGEEVRAKTHGSLAAEQGFQEVF